MSSHCGWTPLRCPTASARMAPSASCTSRSPAPQAHRQQLPPAPPQETTGRWAPWWTVTSAARRNWWCWAEPVPPKPIWWLCPVKGAHCHLGLLCSGSRRGWSDYDLIRVSLLKAKNMKWNSERRKKAKEKSRGCGLSSRWWKPCRFDIFYPLSPPLSSVLLCHWISWALRFPGEALWKWNCWGS